MRPRKDKTMITHPGGKPKSSAAILSTVQASAAHLAARYDEAIALLREVQGGHLTAGICLRIDAAIRKAEGKDAGL